MFTASKNNFCYFKIFKCIFDALSPCCENLYSSFCRREDIRCSCGLLNSERTPDGKTHYYLFDNLDSVVGLTDSQTGNDDNMYDYDPYGQMKGEIEAETNPFKYASGYLDTTTNLYHFGARYYDPSLGRWTQQDPVAGSLGDLNSSDRYVYANDDPINLVDPSGRDCGGAILDAIAAILSFGTLATTVYNAVIPAIIATTFFPPAVLRVIAVVTGLAIYLGTAIEIIRAINAALPQCGINFTLQY